MEQYFEEVVRSISSDDVTVMKTLHETDATTSYKSVITGEVFKNSGLSAATYRKVIHRLIGNLFVKVVVLNRQHTLFLTEYGVQGLKRATHKKEDVPNVSPIRVVSSNNLILRDRQRPELHEIEQDHELSEVSKQDALSIISV